MDFSEVHANGEVTQTATGDRVYDQPPPLPEPNPEDVERVKKNWGEDLNTAFPYEKYKTSSQGGEWASSAIRFEWQDDFEDAVAPRDERLEKELFGDEGEGSSGINFDKYSSPSDDLELYLCALGCFGRVLRRKC
jgi:hypothetical protein